MLLKHSTAESRSQKYATFDTYLRLVDPNSPGCGTLDADLSPVGMFYFTENEFFRKNEEMRFFEGKGTEFQFEVENPNFLKIRKDTGKPGKCFEVWKRFRSKKKVTEQQRQAHAEKKKKLQEYYA